MTLDESIKIKPGASRVLVAEDNLVLGELLRFNLERAGLRVAVAINGRDAIEQLRMEPFDLLVTDYEMPIFNGEQICDAARRELNLRIPIVMCSAKGLELDFRKLNERYSIAKLLQKPFSMSELTYLVKTLLREPVHFENLCT
ncbi:MAG: response regulator [Planctomycetes bacterium]|nr:response regulator [Planctomycetota bacterium]